MSVEIPFEGNKKEKAILLLAAAQELGLEAFVIQMSPVRGVFVVPEEVAEKAFGKEADAAPEKTPVAKKAPAKRAAKKGATTKKEGSE